MKRLIITGGLGFIGSNFIHQILKSHSDLRVTNVDFKGPGSNPANDRDLRRNARYQFVKGDIADYAFTRKILKNADTVVNFAAQTHVDRSIANPEPFFASNAKGAFNLFQAARDTKIEMLVHVSTDEVYGSADTGSFDEKNPLNPSSPYSATKAAADLLARAWNLTYKLPVTILRCTNNFGPRQHPEKFIPKAIIRALSGREIPLYGGGRQIRDWIYVEDFCNAIGHAIDHATPGEAYNISAGNELSNREVAERLLRLLGSPDVRSVDVEDRPAHDFRYSLNSEKARKSLDWKPAHTFDEALELTLRWYKDNGTWWRPLATQKVLSETPWKQRW